MIVGFGPGPGTGLYRTRRAAFAGAYDAIPNITAAYAVRRLLTSYTGSLLRMRRSSDNAESDFGYDGSGHLDTATIVAWLSGSGYIVKWYDQSGNGYDAVQTAEASKQPLYVASGQNGRPVLRWDGVDDGLALADSTYLDFGASVDFSILVTGKSNGTGYFYAKEAHIASPNLGIIRMSVSGGVGQFLTRKNTGGATTTATGTVGHNGYDIFVSMRDGTNLKIWTNGADGQTTATTLDSLSNNVAAGIGFQTWDGTNNLDGDIAELIICNAALSSDDRSAAEAAANDYWNVF